MFGIFHNNIGLNTQPCLEKVMLMISQVVSTGCSMTNLNKSPTSLRSINKCLTWEDRLLTVLNTCKSTKIIMTSCIWTEKNMKIGFKNSYKGQLLGYE